VLGFFAANLVGAVVGAVLIATKQMERRSRIPYGVFLALGCGIAVFAGPVILRPFSHHSI
jgi:prepilin signal peptidase PulO-like enzyme (type II secretory pathway)